MKKFRFKLQKILDLRIREERNIQQELAIAVGKQNVLRVKQQRYHDDIMKQKDIFHSRMEKKEVQVHDLMNYQRFNEFADRVIKKSEEEIKEMQPEIDEIRSRLIEAIKKRKALEKLKERKKIKWEENVKKITEKELEDINQKIYLRNRVV